MKFLKLLIACLLVGVGVGLTYFVFEGLVQAAIDGFWYDFVDIEANWILVVPLTIVIGLVFFALQHLLDRASEKKESEGLGGVPSPTVLNLLRVLFIGFFSLVAGASLGPEAILIPASILVGTLAGKSFFGKDKKLVKLLGLVGFVALFTAFFSSIIAGLLGLYLVSQQPKVKLNMVIVSFSLIASVATLITLNNLPSEPYFATPQHTSTISFMNLLIYMLLFAAGVLVVYAMRELFNLSERAKEYSKSSKWWVHGLMASSGLAVIYLIGGSLVQFTGNKSIIPMFEQSASLGLLGLLWLVIVKVIAIVWSKSMGFRGGMIFPTVFVAACLVAIVHLYTSSVDIEYGIFVILAGAIYANRKTHVLF